MNEFEFGVSAILDNALLTWLVTSDPSLSKKTFQLS